MRELFLPFCWIRLLVFCRGISTGSRVPYVPHRPFMIVPFSLCALQPFSAAAVIPSLVSAAR
jgi:hypothetical protein